MDDGIEKEIEELTRAIVREPDNAEAYKKRNILKSTKPTASF